MKPIKTLILVADDGKARLFENTGPGKGLHEFEDLGADFVVGEGVEYADRTGRNSAAPGMAHHGVSDQAEAERDEARERFVKAVLAETRDRFLEGGYDRFVMTAAPATLGVLRAEMPKALKEAVTLEVAKDLVQLSSQELVDHLSDKLFL